MTRKEFVELIVKVEMKYDTSLLQVNGVSFWPMMRMAMFWQFVKLRTVPTQEKRANISNSKWNYLGRLFLAPLVWLKLLYLRLARRRLLVLFAGHKSQHVDINGKGINRFYYAFINHHDEKSEEYGYLDTSLMTIGIGSINIDIKSLMLAQVLRIKYLEPLKYQNATLEVIDDICKYIADELSIDATTIKMGVLNNMDSITAYACVFETILKILKPKRVCGISYYGIEISGLFIAANKLKIPTVDIQHGGQGPQHLAYSNFTKVPKWGYQLLPKYFWVWDQQSKEQLNQWIGSQSFHKVILGGQPWLSAQLVSQQTSWEGLRKPSILFTMQFNELSDFDLSLIKTTKEKFHWYLKPHPTWENNIVELQNEIKNEGLLDTVTLLSAQASLVTSIDNADIHVSKFSGSIIEASLLGTYSIIIDPIGIASYKDLIESKRAFPYLETDKVDFTNLLLKVYDLPKLSKAVLSLDVVLSRYESIE